MTENQSYEREASGTAAEHAYVTLRADIMNGALVPGQRLREVKLSERLGVSRTPVRQALARLETEGLLAMAPRVGLVVASLDPDAVAELYDMREMFEGTAARLAARNASSRELERLQELVDLAPGGDADGDDLVLHNSELHGAMYAAAHNRFLVKSAQAMNDAVVLLGPTTLSRPGRWLDASQEHKIIVAAIVARDPDAAERAMRDHIRRAYQTRRSMGG